MIPNPPPHIPPLTFSFDHYIPELALAVLVTINHAYDSETVRLVVETMAWVAGEEITLN